MALGDIKEHKRHQGSQSGIVSLGSFLFQSQIVLWTRPLLAWRHLLPLWPRQGSECHWRRRGKICQTDRGEEVVRKAECSVTCGRPWGEANDERVGSSPKALESHAPSKHGPPHHVIRGVKLEFSSEACSPSCDCFLFRPPEKHNF